MTVNFKEARLTLGLTQQKMADLCGIHKMTWVKWEWGKQKPPAIARSYVKCLLWLNSQGLLDGWYNKIAGQLEAEQKFVRRKQQ